MIYTDIMLKEFLGLDEAAFKEQQKNPFTEIHKDEYHYLRYGCWQDPINEKVQHFLLFFLKKSYTR